MTENPVRCKYILHMPVSKRRRISREIQKSIALAGSLFMQKKGIALICAIYTIDLFGFCVDP